MSPPVPDNQPVAIRASGARIIAAAAHAQQCVIEVSRPDVSLGYNWSNLTTAFHPSERSPLVLPAPHHLAHAPDRLLADQLRLCTGYPHVRLCHSSTSALRAAVASARALSSPTTPSPRTRPVVHLSGLEYQPRIGVMAGTAKSAPAQAADQIRPSQPLAPQIGALLDRLDAAAVVLQPPFGAAMTPTLEDIQAEITRRGLPWIADETRVGYGRTGSPLAINTILEDTPAGRKQRARTGLRPDYVVLGASLTNALVPLAVVLSRQPLGVRVDPPQAPLASPIALRLTREVNGLLKHIEDSGIRLVDRLGARLPGAVVAGCGLAVLIRPRQQARQDSPAPRMAQAAQHSGVRVSLGPGRETVRLYVPYTTPPDQLDEIAQRLPRAWPDLRHPAP